MSNKTRWTREEEELMIRDIINGHSFETIAGKHDRTPLAIELRLKKIIYENIANGKSFQSISKLLKINEDQLKQYYYSYQELKQKRSGHPQPIIQQQSTTNNTSHSHQSGGSNINDQLHHKLKKLELENKILRLVVENKKLSHQLNKLIKDGKVDKNIKKIIKMIRKS